MKAVLCYHRISDYYDDFNLMNVSVAHFETHMKYLKNHYEVLALEQLICAAEQEDGWNQIAVTFDDGYRDVYRNAFPILEKYQIPATVFITTKNIDTTEENWPDWVMRACMQPAVYHDYFDMENELVTIRCYTRNLQERCDFYSAMSEVCARLDTCSRNQQLQELKSWAGVNGKGRESRRILSTEEIQMLANSPLITIGSHTETHSILSWLPLETQFREIKDSKDKLESITGNRIELFAYPYGGRNFYDETTMELLKSNGYQMAFTTDTERIDVHTDRYQIPRHAVLNYDETNFTNFLNAILGNTEKRDADTTERKQTPLTYLGRLKDDVGVLCGKEKIIIWGYGYWGRELYAELKMMGEGLEVLAFGDRDAEKYGVTEDGIPVLGAIEIAEMARASGAVILIKGIYDWEIFTELKEQGFRNLHIIMR